MIIWWVIILCPMAGGLSHWLGLIGYKRLDGKTFPVATSLRFATAATVASTCGFFISIFTTGSLTLTASMVNAALYALLMTASLVDWKTQWAPTELILPICALVGLSAVISGVMSSWMAIAGLTLFVLAWAFWRIQSLSGHELLPPADCLALFLPILLLGETETLLFFYLGLSLTVALIGRYAQFQRQHKVTIPLLALAFPLLILCVMMEKFVVMIGIRVLGIA